MTKGDSKFRNKAFRKLSKGSDKKLINIKLREGTNKKLILMNKMIDGRTWMRIQMMIAMIIKLNLNPL